MDKEQFIIWLRKYGTEPNVKVYREEFQTNLEENQDNVYTELIKYYQSVDNKTKENLIQCIRLIVEDSVSIVLGLLDGTSNINQEGKFKLYYEEEGEETYLVNNREEDDLLTLWYEDDED